LLIVGKKNDWGLYLKYLGIVVASGEEEMKGKKTSIKEQFCSLL